jgi:hypothetical protein
MTAEKLMWKRDIRDIIGLIVINTIGTYMNNEVKTGESQQESIAWAFPSRVLCMP